MSGSNAVVQKESASTSPAATHEPGTGGAAGTDHLKASLRGMSFEAQSAALEPRGEPVQRKEGDGADHAHSHGEEAAPEGGGTTQAPERKSGDAVPNDVRTGLIDKLKAIPRSKETLDAIEKAGKLDFPLKWSDTGTFHSAGSIFLRTTSTEASWIASMAHELVHLQTFVEGKAADAKKQGRDEFVKAKMDDEINAHAATYLTLLQSGGTAGAAGFSEFKALVEKDHKAQLDAKKWSELDTIAKSYLTKKYKEEFKTNNTSENYYEYWGKHWDKANGK